MLHPLRTNLSLLLSQRERNCHDHLDGNRLIIQISRFVLPFSQGIHRRLIEKGRAGNHFYFDHVALLIQYRVDLDLRLNARLPPRMGGG